MKEVKTVKLSMRSYIELETLRVILMKKGVVLDKKSTIEYSINNMLKKITLEGKRDDNT